MKRKSILNCLLVVGAMGLILTGCGENKEPTPEKTIVAPVLTNTGRTVSWSAVSGATSYDVYVDGTKITSTKELSYEVDYGDLKDKVVYVIATDGTISSPKSNDITISFESDTHDEWTGSNIASTWILSGGAVGINEGVDLVGKSSASNIYTINSEKSYFTALVRMFNGQEDIEVGATFNFQVDGKKVKEVTYGTEDIILPLGTDAVYPYCFDLTEFAGKKVMISLNQDNASTKHCTVTNAKFSAKPDFETKSEYTSWEKADMEEEWYLTGDYRDGVGEGFDLNSCDGNVSSISKVLGITAEKPMIKVGIRMFRGQDGGNDPSDYYRNGQFILRVNGKAMTPVGYTKDSATIYSNNDNILPYYYDLTEFVGKEVMISMTQNNGDRVGHCVITKVELNNETPITTTKPYYFKDDYKSAENWNFYQANNIDGDGTCGEGFIMKCNENDGGASAMVKTFEVTDENKYFGLSLRTFSGQNGDHKHPNVNVMVGDEIQNPIGNSDEMFIDVDPDDDMRSVNNRLYDLSKYVGKVIRLSVNNFNTDAFKICLRSTGFTGKLTMPEGGFGIDELKSSWGKLGLAEFYSEGVNINSWDGYGGIFANFDIPAGKTKLKITARSFTSQSDPGKIELFVNGQNITVDNGSGSNVLKNDTDDDQNFEADITAFAGQNVTVRIMSSDDNATKCCFSKVNLA